MKSVLFAAVAAMGIGAVGADSAEAARWGITIGGGGYGHSGHHHGGYGLRGIRGRGHLDHPGWGHGHYPRTRGYWHDTSHFDYHPGGFQPHGNHYHYVPGHYDFHRDGHWDRH